jgi:hypothetical protein
MTEVASIVVFSEQPERTSAFYRALGVVLEDEDHGDGVIHAAGEVGGVHVAVLPAVTAGRTPGWRAGGSTFAGFWVASLDSTAGALLALGAETLGGHEEMPWGCRVVVADPDGRAVEVNQRHHRSPGGG